MLIIQPSNLSRIMLLVVLNMKFEYPVHVFLQAAQQPPFKVSHPIHLFAWLHDLYLSKDTV